MDRLILRQIEFWGHCGITDAEREVGQRLLVDVEVAYQAPQPPPSSLSDVVDYARLARDVVRLGQSCREALIEALAERLAQYLLQQIGQTSRYLQVLSVVVRLTKWPRCEGLHGGVTVEICRAPLS
jgi:dihydroneopterin aldolase